MLIFFVGVGRGKWGDYLEKGWVGISLLHGAWLLNNFVIAKCVAVAFAGLTCVPAALLLRLRGGCKKRIAAGSGTKVEDVNRLLKQFEQMQKMMKQLSGNGKQGKKMRQMLSQMQSGGGNMGMPF